MTDVSRAAFEIVALAAGRLGSIPLAAQSVIMTTDQSPSVLQPDSIILIMDSLIIVLNTIPFGIGVAASNRVGNLIGSRSALGAKYAAHAAAFVSVMVGAVVMIAMMASKDVCKRLVG